MMNLLVVSDDAKYTENVKSALSGRGFNVLVAKTGEIALEYARSMREKTRGMSYFHCALIAFGLPGMDGLELVQILRREGERMGIVMVSEDGRTAVDKQCEGLEIWTTLYKHTGPSLVVDKLLEAHAFTNLSPEKEEKLVKGFTQEFAKVEHLHKDLLEETTEIETLPN